MLVAQLSIEYVRQQQRPCWYYCARFIACSLRCARSLDDSSVTYQATPCRPLLVAPFCRSSRVRVMCQEVNNQRLIMCREQPGSIMSCDCSDEITAPLGHRDHTSAAHLAQLVMICFHLGGARAPCRETLRSLHRRDQPSRGERTVPRAHLAMLHCTLSLSLSLCWL